MYIPGWLDDFLFFTKAKSNNVICNSNKTYMPILLWFYNRQVRAKTQLHAYLLKLFAGFQITLTTLSAGNLVSIFREYSGNYNYTHAYTVLPCKLSC